jgi:hypothetical protein
MAKHKYIETPEKMWELFEAYRKEVKDNPRIKVEYVGRNGDRVDTPLVVPLTLEGFENFVADLNIIQDLGHYFANTDNAYDDYRTICTRVRKAIRQDQIEGGMVGQYNASITQRLNGLTERTDHSVTMNDIFTGINLDVSEDNSSS